MQRPGCQAVVPRPSMRPAPRRFRPGGHRQDGAFAVMMSVLILVILGFCGLAIELAQAFNRKAELQTAADAIAIAAAKELDGTDAGVTRALAAAARAAADSYYAYNATSVEWTNDAIHFAATPHGSGWLDETAAKLPANALNLFFVKVDTSQLTTNPGEVNTPLAGLLSSTLNKLQVNAVATAGRSSINVAPLAICAMSDTPGEARGTELVEYGFRRGVSYDLMKLNPKDDVKAANYLINPVTLPGHTGVAVKSRLDVVRPFVCTGTLAIPTLAGGRITVEPDFPLDSVYQQLNSRFGTYSGGICNATTAPPDTNVKEFVYSTEFPWMDSAPTGQAAETRTRTTPKQMLTIADLPPSEIPNTTLGGAYGPLWVYAPAVVKDGKYVSGAAEPTSGYTKFSTTDWPTLYSPGDQKIKPGRSYPSTPYKSLKQSPPAGLTGVDDRRVLNVPLLSCPVPAGSPTTAEVVAIAKFFMTVSATDTGLYAEFAGLVPQKLLKGQVELYP